MDLNRKLYRNSREFLLLYIIVFAFFLQYNNFSPVYLSSTEKIILFFDDFEEGNLDKWFIDYNSGDFTSSVSTGELVAISGKPGTFGLSSKENFSILNSIINAQLFYTCNNDYNFAGISIIFYKMYHFEIGCLTYYLSDNEFFIENSTQIDFMLNASINTNYTLSDYFNDNERNITFILENYLTGINPLQIAYYKIRINCYSYLDEIEVRFDDIELYTVPISSPSNTTQNTTSNMKFMNILSIAFSVFIINSVILLNNRRRKN